MDLYNAGPGGPNGSRETVAGYLPPSVVGESRRPVPTAASMAAPDPGPLAWLASSLRRSSHGHARPRHTAGRAAPPVCVSNEQVAPQDHERMNHRTS